MGDGAGELGRDRETDDANDLTAFRMLPLLPLDFLSLICASEDAGSYEPIFDDESSIKEDIEPASRNALLFKKDWLP